MKKDIEFITWINNQLPQVKKIITLKYVLQSVKNCVTLLLTLLLGLSIEAIFYECNLILFSVEIGMYIFLFGVRSLLGKKIVQQSKKLQKEIQVCLREKLYQKEIRAKAECIWHITTGDNQQLFTQDIENIFNCFDQSLQSIVVSTVEVMGIFIIVCFYNYILSLIILLFATIIVLLTNASQKKYYKARKKFRKQVGEYLNWITEHLKGMRDIQMTQSEQMVESLFRKKTKENLKSKERIRFIEIKAERVVEFCLTSFTVLFWSACALMVLKNSLTVGLFYVINKYFGYMLKCLSTISEERINVRNYIPGYEKIRFFCELKSENDDKQSDFNEVQIKKGNKLVFDGISFSYGEKQVFDNMYAEFKPRKMYVIVGANGVGKTTLMNLILRFYYAETGYITFGGKDIEQFSLNEWRNQIGYVQQDNLIFEGTLRENILLYSPYLSEEQIWETLKVAGLYDTVHKWEKKLDTDLMRGERLSEGQKQRIAIARIVAKNPQIVLMDEPTATLDSKTEQGVISDIKEIYKNQILIIITHREKVVQYADEIFVVNKGKISAYDNYEKLYQESAFYKKLFDL